MDFLLNSYFNIFAPVFQEVNLFAMSFAENISMKSPENTDKDLAHKTVVQSGLEEKLNSLEKGLDTQLLKVIYDDGIDLSGGQKQKLALARALYKNAPVVVLDEPTAALDPLAESEIYENFNELTNNKTSIFISHRMSSSKFCDKVLLLDGGKIVDFDSHNNLMKKNNLFLVIWKKKLIFVPKNLKSLIKQIKKV